MKPILFNTDMVRTLLDGRKTVTRRAVKPQPRNTVEKIAMERYHKPYQPGSVMYVRETWAPLYPNMTSDKVCGYIYKADPLSVENYDARFPNGKDYQWEGRWRPSIHMPREAARIFLRVTDVRVERLQSITEEQARAEGAEPFMMTADVDKPDNEKRWEEKLPALVSFPGIWDSAIKPKDRALYSWEANPYVWVIEFERCEKPEGD